jgi:hypothetical protein
MKINTQTKEITTDQDDEKNEFYSHGKKAGFTNLQLDFMWKFKLLEKKYDKSIH